MTFQRDTERIVERWLEDGIDVMPDRVYLSILDRVEHQPQQRAWRVSWRDSTVNAYLKPIIAIAAVVVLAVGGIAFVTQPSRPSIGVAVPSASPTPSPSPSADLSPSATQAWDDRPQCGQVGCGGPLTAGTYTSTSLQPPVTYTLTTPWVNVRDWPDYFMLYPDTSANRAAAAGGREAHPYILILPSAPAVSPTLRCEGDPAGDSVDVDAAGYAASLAAREGLATTRPSPITVGGLTGLRLDVDLEPGGDTGCAPGVPIEPLGEVIGSNEHYRLVVLDKPDGGTLLIRILAVGDAAAFFRDAMPVVQSFEFDLSKQPSPSQS